MTSHQTGTHEQWLAARNELLAKGRDEGDAFQVWIRRHDEYHTQ
jgi:predicted dithiol-disulfide oxidoreductase (DUF899 family)